MSNDTLQALYGLNDPKAHGKLVSLSFDYTGPGLTQDWTAVIESLEPLLLTGELYLFVAISAERTWEQKKSFSYVISKLCAVSGDTVAEWTKLDPPNKAYRVGVIKVTEVSIPALLDLLYKYTYYSFLMVNFVNNSNDRWIPELLTEWKGSVLGNTILPICTQSIISHDGTFVHLLRGYDGFSINCIYPV